MKKLFITSLLSVIAIVCLGQNKRAIKNLNRSITYFNFYQESPLQEVFQKVPKSKGKTKYYIKKDKCQGVYLSIQRTERRQLSNYYIVKHTTETRLYSIEEINNFISKLHI